LPVRGEEISSETLSGDTLIGREVAMFGLLMDVAVIVTVVFVEKSVGAVYVTEDIVW
jgi:hypothetical protein